VLLSTTALFLLSAPAQIELVGAALEAAAAHSTRQPDQFVWCLDIADDHWTRTDVVTELRRRGLRLTGFEGTCPKPLRAGVKALELQRAAAESPDPDEFVVTGSVADQTARRVFKVVFRKDGEKWREQGFVEAGGT
jgi:hypothetical protein